MTLKLSYNTIVIHLPTFSILKGLNPGSGIYKVENCVFLPVSSLPSWRSQFSHLFVWRLRHPVYLAQVCIHVGMTGQFPTPGFKDGIL